MSKEETDLGTHVSLCELRYDALHRRIESVETRLSNMETQVSDLKTSMQQNFTEIKLLMERDANRRTTQAVTTIASVVVGIVGTVLVYLFKAL